MALNRFTLGAFMLASVVMTAGCDTQPDPVAVPSTTTEAPTVHPPDLPVPENLEPEGTGVPGLAAPTNTGSDKRLPGDIPPPAVDDGAAEPKKLPDDGEPPPAGNR